MGYTTSIHLKRRKEWFPNVSQLTHSFPRRSRARRGAGRNCFYYFYRATFSLPHFSVTIPVRKTRHSTYWLSFTCCKNIFRSPQWRFSQPILSFCYTHLCLHFVFIYGQFIFFAIFLAKHLHIFGKNISHYMRHACGFQYVQYFHQKFHWIFTLDNFILVEFEITAAPGGRMFKISKWIILNF